MFKHRIKKRNVSRKLALLTLLFPLHFSPVNADVFDFGIETATQCTDILDLGGLLDIGSLLDFNINIGGCSLSTAGMTDCQKLAISKASTIEKMMGSDYKYVYGGCDTPTTGPASWSSGSSSSGTGEWKAKRLEAGLSSKDKERLFNRTAYYVNPDTGNMISGGGATTLDTEKAIIENALASTLFSDGAEETYIASSSATTENADCTKGTDLDSMQCEFANNIKTYKKVAVERDELIDAETQRTAANMDVSTTPPVILGFPSEDFVETLPVEIHRNFRTDGSYAIITESIFRGKMAAINNHRKNMSDLMIFKSSLGATSTYPSVAQENAKNISAGDLP